ncbi:MAG: hypothetical protein WCB20_03175, partial [Chthoniobacterales bacterium]
LGVPELCGSGSSFISRQFIRAAKFHHRDPWRGSAATEHSTADKSEKLSTQEAGEKDESGIQESTKETGTVRVSWIPGFQISC